MMLYPKPDIYWTLSLSKRVTCHSSVVFSTGDT